MPDQHRSIQTEDTKEGQREIARKAEDAKRQSDRGVGKDVRDGGKMVI